MAAPLAGQIIRASDSFNIQTFTPVWTNVTVGTGAINEGWYLQQGDLVNWGFRLQFGTGGTSSGSVILDLPVAAFTGGGNGLQWTVGSFIIRDASASAANYAGSLSIFTSGGVSAAFSLGNSTTRANNTVPIAGNYAIDDVISGQGVYRAQ